MPMPIPERYEHLRTFAFGDDPKLAEELLALVIMGVKTATCSTEDEPNTSTPGERWVVLDGRGGPRCVIETTEVTYRRFNEVDVTFARDEGEGDRSLDYWRDAHRAYFSRLARFSEGMTLMCERFRLVEVFGDSPETCVADAPCSRWVMSTPAGRVASMAQVPQKSDGSAPARPTGGRVPLAEVPTASRWKLPNGHAHVERVSRFS
jgi:uncharacterized protein YhfF